MRKLGIVWVFLAVVLGSTVDAAEANSWVGKTVILKRDGLPMARTPRGEPDGASVFTDPTFVVVKESGGWIALRQNGKEGWVEKEQAVLLANAIEYFSNRIRRDPGDYAACIKRACAWEAQGNLDNAIQDVAEALRLRPNSHVAHYNRGLFHSKLGHHDQAIQDYTAAIQQQPAFTLAYLNRGIARVHRGDYQSAVHDFTAAIQIEPSYAAYVNRGVAYDRLGSYDFAIADFSTAIRLEPNNGTTYRFRAHSWSAKKDYRNALADYRESIRLNPQDSDSYNGAAWILATCSNLALRNPNLSLEYAQKACAMDGWKEPAFLGTLAAACAANDNFEEAVKWQEKALAAPGYAELFGQTARTRLRLYRSQKAIAAE